MTTSLAHVGLDTATLTAGARTLVDVLARVAGEETEHHVVLVVVVPTDEAGQSVGVQVNGCCVHRYNLAWGSDKSKPPSHFSQYVR